MNSKGPKDLRIDLKRTGGGSVLPDGVYPLRIEKVEVKQGNAAPYLNFTLVVLTDAGKPTGNRIWEIISLSEKSRFMMDQFLDAVGAAESGKISPQWFMGKKVWATLTNETYQGTMKNVVKQFLLPEMAEQLRRDQKDQGSEEAQIQLAFSEDDDEGEEELEQVSVVKNVPEELADGEEVPF